MCSLSLIFILLVAFELKHFICDYVIQMAQPNYYNKKFDAEGWADPLLTHCASHYLFTFFISILAISIYTPQYKLAALVLALVDGVLHFVIDRFKSSPKYLGRYRDQAKYSYWLSTGFDQMMHRLTNFLIIGGICWISSIA